MGWDELDHGQLHYVVRKSSASASGSGSASGASGERSVEGSYQLEVGIGHTAYINVSLDSLVPTRTQRETLPSDRWWIGREKRRWR